MVSDLSKQFMVNETLLKKLGEKQAMNERGLKHAELDQSLLQDCVERQSSITRPSSAGSENRLTPMCSDGNTKSTDDSSSVLRHNVGSELLERSATLVEFDERQEASGHWVPIETEPMPAPASVHCLSTTATNLVNERESCVTSRESQYFTDLPFVPDASHHKAGEEGSLVESITGKDLCLVERLHTNGVVWQSVEALGGSPIQLSKAQRISVREELRRVAASSGQKARLLEDDTAVSACATFDVQIEERMDLLLRPNTVTCHVEPHKYVVRVSHEETSSEFSDPLGNNSDNSLECEAREAAGNSSVSQTEDEECDELQATLTYEHFRAQAAAHCQKPVRVEPETLPFIITSKIDTQNKILAVCEDPLSSNGILHLNSKQRCTNMLSVKGAKTGGSSQNLQNYEAEERLEGSRKGKRKRCEDGALTNAITATKLEAGQASLTFPSNYAGVCFGCKGSLISEEKVDCSRNDCDRVYHLNCAIELSDASWSFEGKLVCPQHVCYACGKSRGARLWRCQNCPLATHENCIPCPEVTTLSHKRPGWAICWRHASDVDYKLKTRTWDCQDIFRYLPVPEIQQEFSLSPRFIKEMMENEREPPPYFLIRRNVFLIKKKRDDADDGVGCSCRPTQDVCGEDCECRVQSMSCSKDCKCSDKCSNKPFRKDKHLKVCKTAHCGWGAFAAEAIKKDEFVIEYTGEVINDAMCEKRLWEMKGRRSICNFYMCEIAKDFIIDATRKGNASRYLNHSCQPNCRLEKRVDGETRVGVFAGRNITAGEELNYDYKYVEFGPNVTCRCGAPNCRGAIGERFNSNRKSNVVSIPIKWGSQHKRSSLA